jgi:Fe-S oxidoreductase
MAAIQRPYFFIKRKIMTQNMSFAPARREQAKLRLAITGPSGSGKTRGALFIAKGLGGRIAVVDTERKSSALYDNIVAFDVMDLQPPYTPEVFEAALRAAEAAGYNVVILDSITPEWSGTVGF